MKLFKINIKFEQDGKWSDRTEDIKGYLIKESDEDDTVVGFIQVLYPTKNDPIRYVKGLYNPNTSLIFLQMTNESSLSPICYCFPELTQEGYWSGFNRNLGFFPAISGYCCSDGHATLCIEEVTADPKIVQKTSTIFAENSSNATWANQCLMNDYKSLTDFFEQDILSQIKLHCGKW